MKTINEQIEAELISIENTDVELAIYHPLKVELDAILAEAERIGVPDASTEAGYLECKELGGRAAKFVSDLETQRKAFKAPVLKYGKTIDAQAKFLDAKIRPIRNQYKAAYLAEDHKVAERKERIKANIDRVNGLPMEAEGMPISSMVNDLIDEVSNMKFDDESFGKDFEQIQAQAMSILPLLGTIYDQKKAAEDEAEKREAERAAQEKELEELRAFKRQKEEEERRDAEIKAARERQEAEAEAEKQRQIEREAYRKRVQEEAEKRAEQAALDRIEARKREEAKREQARIEDEAHRLDVQNQAFKALAEQTGNIDFARKTIELIDQGLIPFVGIQY